MTDDNETTKSVRIERTFDAPCDLLWRMWTEAEHFSAWYGPNGATVPVAKLDTRVGGVRLVCMEMQTPKGIRQMWFTGEFLELTENKRLVYTEAMSDENGIVLPPSAMGMPDDHPMTTEVTVQFEDIDGRTKMIMTHAGVPADSPGGAGWTMAIDKLAARVEAHATG
jgi:uncharacterized protein YndB with AHSA1/START domain